MFFETYLRGYLIFSKSQHELYLLGMGWDPFGEGFSSGGFMGGWRGSGADHISLVIPQEGPLWKQGCIDLLNAIPAIFSLGYFLN